MMKHLVLSEQDRQLLLHLHQFIYLSKEFIDDYIYNNPKDEPAVRVHERSVYRRLNKLEEAGYITSFSVPIKENSKRPSYIFTLTKFGLDVVEQMTGVVHWQTQWSHKPQIWYMHTLTMAEVVKSFEYNAPEGIMVKEFIPEARGHYEYFEKEKRHVIRPDGILIIGSPYSNENAGIMLEMERSYASRPGTIRKLEQYNRFFDGYVKKGKAIENEAKFKKYEERMKKFDIGVGFEYPVDVQKWSILFIGDNESMGKRILNQLRGLDCNVKLSSASKDDLKENPYGEVYRTLLNPDKLSGL